MSSQKVVYNFRFHFRKNCTSLIVYPYLQVNRYENEVKKGERFSVNSRIYPLRIRISAKHCKALGSYLSRSSQNIDNF